MSSVYFQQLQNLPVAVKITEVDKKYADWGPVADELDRRGKNAPWLAKRLGYKQRQTVYGWKYKGRIPVAALPALADVLGQGWTVDRLLGGAPGKREGNDYSPMARMLAEAFEKITDERAQLGAYSHCIAVIARACDGPPEPPTGPPGPLPNPAPARRR